MFESQTEQLNKLRVYATQINGRLFRNNVGEGWVGKEIWKTIAGGKLLSILNPRKILYGLTVGSSDLIGWKSIVITEEMVGQQVAVFWAMEVKKEYDSVKTDQARFLNAVASAGGIAEIARTKNGKTEIKGIG